MARPQKVRELKASESSPASLAACADDELLELVQRQTFRFFWEGSHPLSGLAPDSCPARKDHMADLVAIGGSGFGVMALIVAVERDWVTREAPASCSTGTGVPTMAGLWITRSTAGTSAWSPTF